MRPLCKRATTRRLWIRYVTRPIHHYSNSRLIPAQKSLRDAIHIDNLFAKAELLQDIAYKTEGKNRVIGSKGHEDTVAYIKGQLEQFPDYYTVETQAVPLNIGSNASLTANNKTIEAFAVTLAPGGNVTGPLVAIPNLGCEEVSRLSKGGTSKLT